jgi:hypothetical protein
MAVVVRGRALREDLALWDGRTKTATRTDATGGTVTGLTVGESVDLLQVYGDGVSRTTGTIAAAIANIGSTAQVELLFATGTWTIDSNLTIPANFTCVFPRGAVLAVSDGDTLTINGEIRAGLHQIFSGAGDVFIATDGLAQWFGAVGDGSTDDTAAFDALENARSGVLIDLRGLTYDVDAVPTGNDYYNGFFTVSGTVTESLLSPEASGLISVAAETNLTSDTTLSLSAIGKAYVLSDGGTPANYTVELPSGATVGDLIMFRVSTAADKLYTLSGVDVGIDGESDRVMWRGESALLMRETSQWTKIGGLSIPFRGMLVRTASQSFAEGSTYVKCTMTDEAADRYNLDLCFSGGEFVCPRLGNFHISYNLSIGATVGTATAAVNMGLALDGATSPTVTPATLLAADFPVGANRVTLSSGGIFTLTAGTTVELIGRIVAGGGGGTATSPVFEVNGTIIAPTISYFELPLW